jgi:hypothetical protein
MGVAPVQIHLMSQIDGVIWAFIKNRQAAGRPKDLADIDALREPER